MAIKSDRLHGYVRTFEERLHVDEVLCVPLVLAIAVRVVLRFPAIAGPIASIGEESTSRIAVGNYDS